MPSQKATRPDDKRLATPGVKAKKPTADRTRYDDFIEGKIDIKDLDDKELEKCRLRGKNGKFGGPGPKVLPRQFVDAVYREKLRRSEVKFREELEPSRKVLAEIRDNRRAPADARYKSAVYLIERAAGKVPEKSEVKVEMAPWEINLTGILVDDDEDEDEGSEEG